ncbi:hypothetical protein I6E61_03405 [Psychrobacter sp. NZS113]|uniref:hypothetical protein n=1 Tax=Psychrobacter sp. NZS113 TaxID=2792045 RepID=UPI0018CFA03F|nr:hypothetical protein [Psychrobacter sp. NZS113]MBH0095430.1 hypothetical protein [Psychrobacter sp. NZS113]
MKYLNIDFEKEVNFEELIKLFLDKFNDLKVAIVINSELFSNLEGDDEKASIFWNISDIDIYKDIKIRSSIDFSKNIDLSRSEFLLWLHMISINLDSKIYVQIDIPDIPDNPIGFFVAWRIDGKSRSLVLEAEEVFEDTEFAYCEPIIDMTKYLDV